ncbi:junctional sarcoplasmic reticulum protein 1 isoform X2 [Larus michahellis]|uniref:junctional sarcoplasmic reticulum protein 1 isoform X2 n=1 Tax=Larus michahellis TaxID=119627 RepID=UPI003D9B168B
MAAGSREVLEKDLGCPEATDELPGQVGSPQRQPRKDGRKDADAPVSSDGESGRAHDPDEPELSMPEPAPLSVDKKVAEKKRAEKVGAKGSATAPPVPRSLPVQRKVEPPSLDPAEEPLLWEGLTLNKCILVASVVALLSVTFQVLQAPCSREGISRGRQDPPPPPLHEVVSAKEEEVQEVVTAQPAQPESSMFEAGDGDDDGGDDGDDDDEADSNLAEPWIFKKWFGRSTPKDEDEDEDEDENENENENENEEPVDVPEEPPAVMEVKKSREKKPEKKEEKAREGRATQAERSSRREARAKDRAQGDKPSRAPRAPREPEQQPQRKRGREGKESRRERDEPRKEGWKGRPGRTDGGRESPKRDWRQQKGRKPWEPVATPGKDGTARHREGKRRD